MKTAEMIADAAVLRSGGTPMTEIEWMQLGHVGAKTLDVLRARGLVKEPESWWADGLGTHAVNVLVGQLGYECRSDILSDIESGKLAPGVTRNFGEKLNAEVHRWLGLIYSTPTPRRWRFDPYTGKRLVV